MVLLAISVCQKESKCFNFSALPAGSNLCSFKRANLCGSAQGLPRCLYKEWWDRVRDLLRQKRLMPLQNLFILKVYQIANPACQLCNFCYNFHPRRLFVCFFLNSFLGDAASLCGLCFTSWLILSIVCRAFPCPLQGGPHRYIGAISLSEQAVTPISFPLQPTLLKLLSWKKQGSKSFQIKIARLFLLETAVFPALGLLLLLLSVWFIPSFHSNRLIFVAVSVCSLLQWLSTTWLNSSSDCFNISALPSLSSVPKTIWSLISSPASVPYLHDEANWCSLVAYWSVILVSLRSDASNRRKY